MSLLSSEVFFLRANDSNGKIIGVISFNKTSAFAWRSRGVWVNHDHRRKGIGSALMNKAINIIKKENSVYIWSMPKVTAFPFYQKMGFKAYKEINTYENGPHFLAKLAIEDV